MAIGGGLQSSLPAHGLTEEEINEATTSANEQIEELPNEAAEVVVIDQERQHISLNEAGEPGEGNTPRLPKLLHLGSQNRPSSSQTTLTGEASSSKINVNTEKGGSARSVHDVERQLEAAEEVLHGGQEARLDFSKIGQQRLCPSHTLLYGRLSIYASFPLLCRPCHPSSFPAQVHKSSPVVRRTLPQNRSRYGFCSKHSERASSICSHT